MFLVANDSENYIQNKVVNLFQTLHLETDV